MRYVTVDRGVVDVVAGELCTRDGRRVALARREVDLLAHLARHAGQVVSREELERAVWGVPAGRALDLALRRLRGRLEARPSEPVHLVTVVGLGHRFVPGREPPLASGLASSASAPILGREDLLATLEARLAPPDGGRVVTLVGAPGIGKTRVALELARRAHDRGRTVILVSLAGAPDLDRVLAAVGERLALTLTARDALARTRTLGNALAARGCPLLVLDDGDRAATVLVALVPELLAAARQLDVVVTAGRALDLGREQVVPVPPLRDDDALELFLHRATGAHGTPPRAGGRPRPGPRAPREMSEESKAQFAAVVPDLGGLPLAIELAAARARLLGPRQLGKQLRDCIRRLRRDDDAGPAHDATLRAAFESAWEQLDDPLRAAVSHLAAFAGELTDQAAAAVLDLPPGGDPATVLARLTGLSLLRPTPRGHALHPRIRGLVHEKTATLPDQGPALRHLRCVACLGARSVGARSADGVELAGGPEPSSDDLELALERSVLLAPQLVAGLAMAAHRALSGRGLRAAAARALDRALALAAPLTPAERVGLLDLRAAERRRSGELEPALADAREALALVEAHGLTELEARVRLGLAAIHVASGELDRAGAHLTRALSLAARRGDRPERILDRLAALRHAEGHDDDAADLRAQAIALHRAAGDLGRVAAGLLELGHLDLERGDLDEARSHLEEARAIFAASGPATGWAACLAELAELSRRAGDPDGAEVHLLEAADILRGLADRRALVEVLTALAGLERQRGRLEDAADALDEAEGLAGRC